MSNKNNQYEYSASYAKCGGFGFCACCNETVCTYDESNNSMSTETSHSKSTKTFYSIVNEKIKNIRSRKDKTTYTKDEVIQILKSC